MIWTPVATGHTLAAMKESAKLTKMIGKLLLLGLISGGAMFLGASPSSALPDNPCMDAFNYQTQLQWYENQTETYYQNEQAWQSADHYVNPLTGGEVWVAQTSTGLSAVYNLTDYNHKVSSAQYDYNHAWHAMADWDNSVTVC